MIPQRIPTAHKDSFGFLRTSLVGVTTTYSSFLLIKCTRGNDAQDTYAGEIALLDTDAHYVTNRNGSLNEMTD